MTHPCHQCHKFFCSKQALAKHQPIHDPERQRKFKCLSNTCDKAYFTKRALKRHTQNTHFNIKNYQCTLCEAKFKSKQGLDYHITGFHCQEKAYQCDKCPKRFVQPNGLSSHAVIHTDEKQFKCLICRKSFKRLSCLRTHSRSQHEEKTHFNCSDCHKSFNNKSNFRRHFKTTHEPGRGPRFGCYFCGTTFIARSYLERHISTHTGEKPFSCPVQSCGFSTSYNGALTDHKKRLHPTPGQPPHRIWNCYFCSKTHKSSGHYLIYLRSHTLETPFLCNLCSGSFSCVTILKSHIFTHTKEKIFKYPKYV